MECDVILQVEAVEVNPICQQGFRKWDIFVQTTHPKTDGHGATRGVFS